MLDAIPIMIHLFFMSLIEKPVKWVGKYLRRWAYGGLKLAENWSCQFEIDAQDAEETIKLKQYGQQIEGRIDSSIGHAKYQLNSKFFGEIVDEYIFAFYKPISKGDFGSGVILLRILERGTKLEGCCAFQYTKDRSRRIIEPYIWQKTSFDQK